MLLSPDGHPIVIYQVVLFPTDFETPSSSYTKSPYALSVCQIFEDCNFQQMNPPESVKSLEGKQEEHDVFSGSLSPI